MKRFSLNLLPMMGLLTCLVTLPVLAQENGEGLDERMRVMGIEARELELQEQRMELELRKLELEQQRLENETLERELRGTRDDDDDDDEDEEEDDDERHDHGDHGEGVIVLIVIVAHILAGVWVHGDARDRGVRAGIWIALALLTGFFGTLIYAVVRLGDLQASKGSTGKKK